MSSPSSPNACYGQTRPDVKKFCSIADTSKVTNEDIQGFTELREKGVDVNEAVLSYINAVENNVVGPELTLERSLRNEVRRDLSKEDYYMMSPHAKDFIERADYLFDRAINDAYNVAERNAEDKLDYIDYPDGDDDDDYLD